MLFFRSEECVREWCVAHDYPIRPLFTMDQLWTLATTWYSTQLAGLDVIPACANDRHLGLMDHSLCIAIIGSTRAARQAGSREAPIETNASSVTAAEKLSRSSGLTSNNRLESERVRNNEPTIPTTDPSAVRTALLRSTWETTRPRVAPSAIRIPNS